MPELQRLIPLGTISGMPLNVDVTSLQGPIAVGSKTRAAANPADLSSLAEYLNILAEYLNILEVDAPLAVVEAEGMEFKIGPKGTPRDSIGGLGVSPEDLDHINYRIFQEFENINKMIATLDVERDRNNGALKKARTHVLDNIIYGETTSCSWLN